MANALILTIILYIWKFEGCSATMACDSSHQKPVAYACRTANGPAQSNKQIFLDTSTGSNNQHNRCRCRLEVYALNISLVFKAGESMKELNHTIEVGDQELNRTVQTLNVILSSGIDLWIITNGVQGVCVSVSVQYPGGPVVGGVASFVVLVAVTSIIIFCIRRTYSKRKGNGLHSDKSSIVQGRGEYVDMTENQVSERAVVDNPIQSDENLAVYAVVNKPKLQTNNTDNVYDRTDISGETVNGTEEYNRLGAFLPTGVATDNTYDSANSNISRNVNHNVEDDYDTSYRKT